LVRILTQNRTKDTHLTSAHRFLVGYVYVRTHSQTGGLLQLWLLRRFAALTGLQPLILGLILLSRRLWPEGGALCGCALAVLLVAEFYCARQSRLPGLASLGPLTRRSLETFGKTAKPSHKRGTDEENTDLVGDDAGMNPRARGSFASVLEMMSITLAVMPGKFEGPVPLRKYLSRLPTFPSHIIRSNRNNR
jgi:calcium permeable stress-gated cation channel